MPTLSKQQREAFNALMHTAQGSAIKAILQNHDLNELLRTAENTNLPTAKATTKTPKLHDITKELVR
jgi:hypothetical protein